MCDRLSALLRTSPSSIMPKDPTEKKEKKEKKEKREKKKKEVVQEATAEAPTTDVPEDVEMDNVKDTKVSLFFSFDFNRSDSCPPIPQVTKKPKKERKEEQGEIVIPVAELSPIAHPLAQKRLLRKLNKAVKKGTRPLHFLLASNRYGTLASKARQVKRGVKEVVKGIRKGEKG